MASMGLLPKVGVFAGASLLGFVFVRLMGR
jgi:hypothetical protein